MAPSHSSFPGLVRLASLAFPMASSLFAVGGRPPTPPGARFARGPAGAARFARLPGQWPGLNLLGFALMEVRRQLRSSTSLRTLRGCHVGLAECRKRR